MGKSREGMVGGGKDRNFGQRHNPLMESKTTSDNGK